MADLQWKPNPALSIPLYKQIEEYIKEKILNGEWTVGTKIPSQRSLAESFGVNRSTVATALDELTALGFMAGKRGGGTRVINNTWSLLASVPPPDWNTYVKAGIHRPNLPTIQEINRAEFVPGVIRLGTGELSPELLPADKMRTLFRRLSERAMPLGYERPKGNLYLRQQISTYVKSMGIDCSSSSILIVSGTLQALQLISIGLLPRGSTILLEKPSYLYSVHVFQSSGMKLFGVPLDEQGIQISRIAQFKKQHNGALLYTIPTFHNPTGTVMSEKRRTQLMEVCENESLPVIEDDVYRDLWLDASPPKPLKAYDKNGIVLYLGSMSKTISPGLRIGWVIGPEPVIDRMADIKMQTDYGSSSLSQWAAAEWFSSGLYEEHIESIRKQLKIRKETAIQALKKYLGDIATWTAPTGGFYIWIRLLPTISIRELFEKALAEGILLNPGNIYDLHANQYLRLSYAYASLTDLVSGMKKLSILIRRLTIFDR